MSQFQQPGVGGDKFTAAEHNGALLLFFPSAYRTDIPTQHGVADAVEGRIVNLDSGQVLENAMVFGRALVGQLKGAVPDGMVLGRLGQGQNQKGNPPWMLFSHTEQDVARAEAWIAANPVNKFNQPQAGPPTPAASPAPGTWGAQPQGGPVGGPAPAAWQNAGAPASQTQYPGQWGNAAPAAAPAPAAPAPAPAAPAAPVSPADPALVAALAQKGVDANGMSHEQALSIWNMVGGQ